MQGREQRREQTAPPEHSWGRAPPGCFPPTFLRAPQACSRGRARRRTLVHHPTTHGPPLEVALGVKPRPSPTVGQTLVAGGLGTTCTAMAVMLHRGPAALPPPGCCRRLPSWNLSSGAERGGSWAGGRAGREAAFKAEQLTPGRARPAPLHSAARFSLSQRGSWEEPPGQGGG